MLVNGDLVRIPQGTVVHDVSDGVVPIQIVDSPQVGIVIEHKAVRDLIKILLNDQVCFVEKQMVQLICGGKSVY